MARSASQTSGRKGKNVNSDKGSAPNPLNKKSKVGKKVEKGYQGKKKGGRTSQENKVKKDLKPEMSAAKSKGDEKKAKKARKEQKAQEKRDKEEAKANTTVDTLGANDDFIAFDFSDEEDSDDSSTSDSDDTDSESEDDSASSNEKGFLGRAADKVKKFMQDTKSTLSLKRKRDSSPESDSAKRARKAGHPWTINKSYSNEKEVARILHREILDFVDYLGPTPEEHELRHLVVERIRAVVKKTWPQTEVRVFGSYDTRLYLPTSDIDLVVLSTGSVVYEKKSHLYQLSQALTRAGIAQKMQVIAGASVPIIKFVDTLTQISVDVSFNKPSGLIGAQVIKGYCQSMPALRPLVLVIKWLLQQRDLNEVYTGGLGSYAIICICVSFLQLHPKLSTHQISAQENLGVLLMEFFELYGSRFNYDTVGISIAGNGGKGAYFRKATRGWINHGQTYLLSIEDPSDEGNDIAKASRGIMRVKAAFSGAYSLLQRRMFEVHEVHAEGLGSKRGGARHTKFGGAGGKKDKEREGEGVEEDLCLLKAVVGIDEKIMKMRRKLGEVFYSRKLHNELGIKEGDMVIPPLPPTDAASGDLELGLNLPPAAQEVMKNGGDRARVRKGNDIKYLADYHSSSASEGEDPRTAHRHDPIIVTNVVGSRAPTSTSVTTTTAPMSPRKKAPPAVTYINSSDIESDNDNKAPALAAEDSFTDSRTKSVGINKDAKRKYWATKGGGMSVPTALVKEGSGVVDISSDEE
ncbi:Poly(A) polymerase [Saitoella coloradoensis]